MRVFKSQWFDLAKFASKVPTAEGSERWTEDQKKENASYIANVIKL